jgi:integrase
MGRKRTPGLYKRRDTWHIDKFIFGRRIYENTGTGSLEEAEKFLALRVEQMRQTEVFGIRQKRSFLEAATKYLKENTHKASLKDDALQLSLLAPWIGKKSIDAINMNVLLPFIEHRRKVDKVKTRTANYALQVTRRILNLAASDWMDDNGLTWLHTAPKIKLLQEIDRRPPYPLSWDEQERLLAELPEHVANTVLFAVNTGCREKVIRALKWQWEIPIPELDTSVFVAPGYVFDEENNNQAHRNVKNGEDRLIVLNTVAKGVIDKVRGKHPEYVFTYKGNPMLTSINNTAWQNAVKRTGIPVRIHDLKHTFGRRLRSAGVGFEDRQDLLGHKSNRITTHYSVAELENLIAATNKACDRKLCGTMITVFKSSSHQIPTNQVILRARNQVAI